MRRHALRFIVTAGLGGMLAAGLAGTTQAGSHSAQSNVTRVDTRTVTGLAVSGRVLEAGSRAPLGGVTVTLAGQTQMTSGNGGYSFSNVSLSAGSMVTASRAGFRTQSRQVEPVAGAGTVVVDDVLLSSAAPTEKPEIVGIRAKYEGMFLSGASLRNEYTASVDWHSLAPRVVEFYVNGQLSQTPAAQGSEITAKIDMALGFSPSLTIGANQISAVAVAVDGSRSEEFSQPVTILPMPLFLVDQALLLPFEFIPGNQPAISWEFNFPRSFMTARDVKRLPFVGDLGTDLRFDVAFDYQIASGEWGLFAGKEWDKRLRYRSGRPPKSTPLNPKFYFGNVDFDWHFGGKAEGTASQTRGIVVDRVGLELAAGVRMEVLSFYFTDYVPGGQVVRLLDTLKQVGVDVNSIQRVRVDGLLDAELSAFAKLPELVFDRATLKMTPGVEAVYEPSLSVVHGLIAVGGNIGFNLELAPEFGLDEITAAIYLRLHFDALLLKEYDETFVILSGTLYERQLARPALRNVATHAVTPLFGDQRWVVCRAESESSTTVSREYLRDGSERFVVKGGSAASLAESGTAGVFAAFRQLGRVPVRGSVGPGLQAMRALRGGVPAGDGNGVDQADLAVVENVFPNSSPTMADQGGQLMLLYVADNGAANALQFTDIHWTFWNGETWSVPTPIQADTRAEFTPQVAFDGNGNALAVWSRVADEDFSAEDLTAMAAELEIVWSRWDRETGTWSEPTALTANQHVDHSPLLCGPMANGNLLLLWTDNQENLLMGSEGVGADTVRWCEWNVALGSWSEPQVLLTGLAHRLSQSVAGIGEKAVYAWTVDADGDTSADDDQEVFYVEYAGGTWGLPQQMTSNAVPDKNVRVAVGADDTAYLVWQQDEDLVMSRNYGEPTMVRSDSATAGFADFALSVGPLGHLVLLWQEMSEDGSDAHYAVFDPASDTWGKDDRLCQDSSLERSFAPAWDSLGNLLVAYNKVEMLRTNKAVTLEGGDEITITNVPMPGRVDLLVTRRALVTELELAAGDFRVEGVNYLPGDPLTLGVTVRNAGNVAVADVTVSLFDGDPNAGGTLITNLTVAGWLEAAATADLETFWVVPEPAAPHTLYAVVDNAGEVTEFNEDNNSQSISIGGTDLMVSLKSSHAELDGSVRVIGVVQNLGAPTAPTSTLAIRVDGVEGEPLATAEVPTLEPGRLAELAFDLPPGTQPEGEVIYRLFADEAGVANDVDLENNTTAFAVNLWVDTDEDGIPDGVEQEHDFLSETDPNDAALDFDGDGLSNLAEYEAGTDLADPHSYLRINSLVMGSEDAGVELRWGSASSRLYTVLRSAAVPGGFVPVAEHIQPTPPENVWVDQDAALSGAEFYRLKVE